MPNEEMCCLWKCGRKSDYHVLQEIDGTGRTGWLGYCEFHFNYYKPEGTVD